jgi:hypothetical protein
METDDQKLTPSDVKDLIVEDSDLTDEKLLGYVRALNEEVFRSLEGKTVPFLSNCGFDYPFSYNTNGLASAIEFMGINIWCSENDEREYDEEKDDYEPMMAFIRRQVKTFVMELLQIGMVGGLPTIGG